MTNVIDFKTRLGIVGDGVKISVPDILEAAKDLDQVVIVGTTKENELYVSSSDGILETHWLLTLAKQFLVDIHNEEA